MLLMLWHACRFAFGWVLALTALLILGTRESARFNLVSLNLAACLVLNRLGDLTLGS